jgi:hypothetical protein
VLDTGVHRNVQISDVTVSDVLASYYLPTLFHNLESVSARDISVPVEIHTDWTRFRSLTSDLISPRTQIDTSDEAERAGCIFAASIASAYRLSTGNIILSEIKKELQELDRLLQLEQRLRNLWHETMDPACKTAFKWVAE